MSLFGNRKKLRTEAMTRWQLVGFLLIFLAVIEVLVAFFGSYDNAFAALFFDEELVAARLAEVHPFTDCFERACNDDQIRARFDSSSVRKFDEWCAGAATFRSARDTASAVALLKASNMHFGRVCDKLFNAGGAPAETSLEFQRAYCELKPMLEDIASEAASARFNQFLVGLLFLVAGILFLVFGRQPAGREK